MAGIILKIGNRRIEVLKGYVFLIFITSLLGVSFFSVDFVFFQLSPYRFFILFSPFMLFFVKKEQRLRLRREKNIFSWCVFLSIWILYSIFTLFWVDDYAAWTKSFIMLLCACMITWLIALTIHQKSDFFKMFKILECIGLLYVLWGMYEVFTGDYLFALSEVARDADRAANSGSTIGMRMPLVTHGNTNDYAFFMMFIVFNSMALAYRKVKRSGRVLSWLIVTLCLFLILCTQSRSVLIGVVLGFCAMIFSYFQSCSLKRKIRFLMFVGIGFCLCGGLFISNLHYVDGLFTVDIHADTGSDEVRMSLIKNGLIILYDHAFLGTGLSNIEYHMAKFPIETVNIHNWWFEILVSSGVIIFLLYIGLFLCNLNKAYRLSVCKRNKQERAVSRCILGWMIAFVIGCMGSSSLVTAEWMWPLIALYFSYIGFLWYSNVIEKEELFNNF